MSKSRNAILIESNKPVQVYFSSGLGKWIDRVDCKTEYTEKQLEFIDK